MPLPLSFLHPSSSFSFIRRHSRSNSGWHCHKREEKKVLAAQTIFSAFSFSERASERYVFHLFCAHPTFTLSNILRQKSFSFKCIYKGKKQKSKNKDPIKDSLSDLTIFVLQRRRLMRHRRQLTRTSRFSLHFFPPGDFLD